jgi:hypothetical protein
VRPVELVTEPLERGPRLFGWYLGVDLHRERYAAVPQDGHSHTRVYAERGQQRAAGSARVVNGDPANSVPLAPPVKVAVDVPWRVRQAVAGQECQRVRLSANAGVGPAVGTRFLAVP